ncbi:MAG TPA: sulfate adenylyltransferase [Chloroflexota bacterium]|nr:sulfate adenylyltransferase [Chloroflexota bacterium]
MGVSVTLATKVGNDVHYGAVPHGGTLVNRFATGEDANRLATEAAGLVTLELSARELSDVEMLAIGGYSPLKGFMTRADYDSVVRNMRLENGLPWTIPVTLSIDGDEASRIRAGNRVALAYRGERLAVLDVQDVFRRDKSLEAREVYRTTDEAHPGVAALLREGDTLIGGELLVFGELPEPPFPDYSLRPADTRRVFEERGWRTVVGFQTRNPVHRAHEYLQKCAMEIVDGLLLHPLVGETKSDDIPADIRMRSYRALLDAYYPHDRVLLSVNPAAMRYGGPREAIFHAIIRKNYGCTHFIVGRDHAGVPGYYGPYDAQYIFSDFGPDELGIQPLFFENAFFCKACGNMASDKTCPHDVSERVTLSGTQVRAMLRAGELPPPQFSRPEVARILAEAMREN